MWAQARALEPAAHRRLAPIILPHRPIWG